MLSIVGLEPQADAEASTLPLGSRRLLEVARALCARPRVLLLDEPAAGLSSSELDQLANALRLIAARRWHRRPDRSQRCVRRHHGRHHPRPSPRSSDRDRTFGAHPPQHRRHRELPRTSRDQAGSRRGREYVARGDRADSCTRSRTPARYNRVDCGRDRGRIRRPHRPTRSITPAASGHRRSRARAQRYGQDHLARRNSRGSFRPARAKYRSAPVKSPTSPHTDEPPLGSP